MKFAKDKNILSEKNFQDFADISQGFTGADIENVVNESSYEAIRKGRDSVDNESLKVALNEFLKELE